MSKKNQIKVFEEGKAKILTTYNEVNKKGQLVQNQVFYNPLQVFNRDLTVAVINQHTKYLKEKSIRGGKDYFDGVTILDALSASGLRAIRFLKELEDIKYVYANDISEASHKLMMDNFKLNELDLDKIKMTLKDANQLMYEQKFKLSQNNENVDSFDIIDLDPYGSAIPFLDAAIQNARTDTLLCVTCTDSKVLNGPDTQRCFYQYGSSRAKVPAFQENALRIVLYTIASIASKYNKNIIPLFSYMQKEFYCRLFIQIKCQRSDAAKTFTQIGNVFYCEKCHNSHYHTYGKAKTVVHKNNQKNNTENDKQQEAKNQAQKQSIYNINSLNIPSGNCDICGSNYQLNGPIWLGDLHNIEFCQQLLANLESEDCKLELSTHKKITGLLKSVILEKEQFSDLEYVPPLGFAPQRLSKSMKINYPGHKKIESAFTSLGYKFVHTFTNVDIFKSNAPNDTIYQILKAWKQKSVGEQDLFKNLQEDSVGYKILKRDLTIDPNFDLKIQSADKVATYIPNPKYQGPKARAAIQKVIDENPNLEQEQKNNEQEEQEQENIGDQVVKKVKI